MSTGRKLLLADDSVTIQKVIDLTFSDEGIEVTTVGNGEQAILKLEEIQPDIVLADVFMPGRSGYEVCEHIKRDERFHHIPVLLLVGSFEPFDEAEARRVGADDYLTKPFQSIRQLVSKVTSLLSGNRDSEEPTTRNLELPPELAEKPQAQSDTSADEIHTADTAPLPKELEDKEPAEAAAHLAGHESLDDEMIEARTASEPAERPRETLGDSNARPTAPFSAADLQEAGLEVPTPAPLEMQETMRDFRLHEMNEEAVPTETPGRTQARYMNNAAAADEALLDLGDIEPPTSMMEADDFILDLQDDAPALSEPKARSAEAQQPAASTAVAPTGSNFSQAASSQPEREFPEEPAPVMAASSEASAYEAARAESQGMRDFSMQETLLPEDAEAADHQGASASAEAPAAKEQDASQITLDQLSPAAIDAIARRAVELLSSKVVEEIAWEVVPQLAELLIKRKLEEEKAQ